MVGLGHGTPNVSLDFVEFTSQTKFFYGNEYQGILGLGPAALLDPGTTSYFSELTAASVPATMAFELCATDGTMWLGGYDPSHATTAPQYTPILTTGDNADYYSVDMTAMAIGGTNLGVSSSTFDGPVVDTGTSYMYIPNAGETALIADLNANTAFKALFPSQTLTDPTTSNSNTAGCVTPAAGTTDAMVDAMLPPVSMTFAGVGGGSIKISAKALGSYFEPVGGGQYCLVIYGGGDQGEMTMGDVFIRGFVTVIDRANNKVGFAPTSHCAAPLIETPHQRTAEHGRGPHHLLRKAQ
jgi:hypothetical protein